MTRKDNTKTRSGNRTSRWLTAIHLVFLVLGFCVIGKVAYIQWFWKPTKTETAMFGTSDKVDTITPIRGAIIDTRGRLLASSVTMYRVCMDCAVRKEEFRLDKENGRVLENEWRNKADELSCGLAEIYGGTAADWYGKIIQGRERNRRYMRIGGLIDYNTLQKVKALPLFREGKYKGGISIESEEIREYPYGSLGRRAIGVVQNNHDTRHITGLEEKCNDILHGKEGWTYLKNTDVRGVSVQGNSYRSRKAVNGYDVRTTLDIDIQDIADTALRKVLCENPHMIGGCCMVMEVESGAIRAMVNLKKDSKGNLGETYNYAVTTALNPGSVFKTATLMAALSENKIGIHDSIPCMDGIYVYKGSKCPPDHHVGRADYPSGYIHVDEGLKISSNHVFRYIGCECFGKNPKDVDRYLSLLKSYHLFDDFDFDINGLAKCYVNDPNKSHEALTLPMIAMGYDMATTPIHIMTFYNAIANGGKEMKPYLIEAYEKDGRVVKKFGPEVLNGKICSKAVADTLTQALLKITTEEHGTGYWRFRGSKCKVAGKTGTAFQSYRVEGQKGSRMNVDGKHVIQGTFAGFFPAENPKYTAICVFHTDLCPDNLEGSRCATAVRMIADQLYCMNPQWGEPIHQSRRMEKVEEVKLVTSRNNEGKVPDVCGLGLSDAIYSIESCGYKCRYEGHGQVVSQSPAAFTEAGKGTTVLIRLK